MGEADTQPGKLNPQWFEVGVIFLVFFVWAGGPPPNTNEAHYLAKARHYWDPAWCRGDFFLESADAHWAFYWTFGWVAVVWPLPAAAWIGRVAMWLLQAWSWRRLSWAVVPSPLFSVLSAALMLVLLHRCDLAGEWIVEGVEAKGFAFAFVFFALEAIVRNRWSAAWLWLGAASAFHVLVGGWTVVAAGLAWLAAGPGRPRLATMAPGLAGGLLLALPGLLPAVALTRGVDPQTVAEANQIYVYQRLSHHLLPSAFPLGDYANYGLLLAAFVVLCVAAHSLGAIDDGVRRLWSVVAGAVLIGLAGLAIFAVTQHHPPLAAKWLRFYFFRLSDAFVPLGTALTVGVLWRKLQGPRPAAASLVLGAATVMAAAGVGGQWLARQRDVRPGADRQPLPPLADLRETQAEHHAWRRMCQWVKENTPAEARFLTPRAQQTFKWYAERPEVVTWKDVPQDAAALLEWRRRFADIYGPLGGRSLAAYTDRALLHLARKYDAQYIVVDRARGARRLGLEKVYPPTPWENLYYEVYRVP